MSDNHLFEERQYLGFNKFSFMIRLLLAIFCFLSYHQMKEENPGDLFFVMGITILVISGILIFVTHIKTKVTSTSILLDGIWTARKVKINLSSIISAEDILYSKLPLNRPAYNLHRKGRIRFYTHGDRAVKIIDQDGMEYIVGSQKSNELTRVIQAAIEKNNNVSQ